MKVAGAGPGLGGEGNPEALVLPPPFFCFTTCPSQQQPYYLEISVSGEGWIVKVGS